MKKIILISIYGFSLLRQRRGLPPEIKDLIQKDDAKLIQIDDIRIERKMDMEFILSQKIIGEQSTFLIEIDGKIEKKEAKFVYYYSQKFSPSWFSFSARKMRERKSIIGLLFLSPRLSS
jgi:hypothetical protein